MREVALAILGAIILVVIATYALAAFAVIAFALLVLALANGLFRLFAKKPKIPVVTVPAGADGDPDRVQKMREAIKRSIQDGQDRRLREHFRRAAYEAKERRKSDPLS